MAGSGRGLDKEDIEYVRKSLYSLFLTNGDCDINELNWIKDTHDDSLLCEFFNRKNQLILRKNNIHNRLLDFSDNNCNDECLPISSKDQYSSKALFNDILTNGVDEEDLDFLKRSFALLLCDPNENNWTSKVHWDSHPATSDDNDKLFIKGEVKNDLSNKTGSARSEGYSKASKLPMQIARICSPRQLLHVPKVTKSEIMYSKNYKHNERTLLRNARNDQRRLFSAYQTIPNSNILKLNNLKYRKKRIRLGRSKIHGLGVFASESIDKDEIIIEYVGQIIRPVIADLREKKYKASGIDSYCFKIDDRMVVDATKIGNMTRYINHSCNPNSYSRIESFDNKKKIVIYSKKYIKVDEEITYNYNLPLEDDKIICNCRTPRCKKTIN